VRKTYAIVLVAAAFCATAAGGQTQRQSVQTEIRADAIVSRWTAVQGGVGVSFPAGIYVRTGAVIGAGGGGKGFDSRLDVFSRFNLDPFREKRWGLYGGAGVSGRYAERDEPQAHAYLLLFAGIEGPLHNASIAGWVPALEIGLGGGARFGIAFRQGIPRRR
jgi:hypothetical protein